MTTTPKSFLRTLQVPITSRNFTNADSLKNAMSELPDRYVNLVATEEENLLHMFEDLFDHKSFTGRSGTFFGFEGLGSIYWHMVSKLALAVQETLGIIHKQSDSVSLPP